MKPLMKYPGGKERELKYVIERLPDKMINYYEPFLGGGAVYFGIDDNQPTEEKHNLFKEYFVNDKSEDLILFYNNVKHGHILFKQILEEYADNWEYLSGVIDGHYKEIKRQANNVTKYISPVYSGVCLVALEDKLKRMDKLQKERGALPEQDIKDNIECAIKQGYYYYIREIYNSKIRDNIYDEERAAAFFFMREFCYSSMFRFNAAGEFNVPYGGISYNRKDFRAKIERLCSAEVVDKLSSTTIACDDFQEFLKKYPPKKDDFMFLDPPYDSEFSDYDNNRFGLEEQERLAKYLINRCKCNWLMIIKASPLILSLYVPGEKTRNNNTVHVEGFDKKYSVSFKNRNLKDCEHLIITNY